MSIIFMGLFCGLRLDGENDIALARIQFHDIILIV